MPVGLRVTSNAAEVFAKIDAWVQTVRSDAVPIALNKLGEQARVAGERQVRKTYGLTIEQFSKYITVDLARTGLPEYVITATGKGFPLSFFQPRQTKLGVTVLIKGRRILIPHSFLKAIGPSGLQVWARGSYGGSVGGSGTTGPHRRRKRGIRETTGSSAFESTGEAFGRFAFGLHRFPITVLRSTTPPAALLNPDVVAVMDARIKEQATSVFAAAVKFVSRR